VCFRDVAAADQSDMNGHGMAIESQPLRLARGESYHDGIAGVPGLVALKEF
jgi:hypothetical protein